VTLRFFRGFTHAQIAVGLSQVLRQTLTLLQTVRPVQLDLARLTISAVERFRDPVCKELPGRVPRQSATAPYQSPAAERTYAELFAPAAHCGPHGRAVLFGRRIH
jgi:hypothetical protein